VGKTGVDLGFLVERVRRINSRIQLGKVPDQAFLTWADSRTARSERVRRVVVYRPVTPDPTP